MNPSDQPSSDPADSSDSPEGVASTPEYDFDRLAGDRTEVHIMFQGQTYRLRRTRNDRLILTK